MGLMVLAGLSGDTGGCRFSKKGQSTVELEDGMEHLHIDDENGPIDLRIGKPPVRRGTGIGSSPRYRATSPISRERFRRHCSAQHTRLSID